MSFITSSHRWPWIQVQLTTSAEYSPIEVAHEIPFDSNNTIQCCFTRTSWHFLRASFFLRISSIFLVSNDSFSSLVRMSRKSSPSMTECWNDRKTKSLNKFSQKNNFLLMKTCDFVTEECVIARKNRFALANYWQLWLLIKQTIFIPFPCLMVQPEMLDCFIYLVDWAMACPAMWIPGTKILILLS